MKRVTVLFDGRVQGVGFRYTTQQLAKGFDAVGTVRNLQDGRVELILEGEESELQEFITSVMESDLAGFIKEKKETWGEPEGGLVGFRIAH